MGCLSFLGERETERWPIGTHGPPSRARREVQQRNPRKTVKSERLWPGIPADSDACSLWGFNPLSLKPHKALDTPTHARFLGMGGSNPCKKWCEHPLKGFWTPLSTSTRGFLFFEVHSHEFRVLSCLNVSVFSAWPFRGLRKKSGWFFHPFEPSVSEAQPFPVVLLCFCHYKGLNNFKIET